MAHSTWQAASGPHQITGGDAQAGIQAAAAQVAQQTLGPGWARMPDPQMKYLTALACSAALAPPGRWNTSWAETNAPPHGHAKH